MNDQQRHAYAAKVRANIARAGYHLTTVVGGTVPRFSYTVGLKDCVSGDLVMAGGHFFEITEVPAIIESCRAARTTNPLSDYCATTFGRFYFRPVDPSWARRLMLGARDFYAGVDFASYQIVPENLHNTREIPDLSLPWDGVTEPAWQWLEKAWPYPVPNDSIAITNLKTLFGEAITEVVRWEESEWEAFAGPGPDVGAGDVRRVPLSVLLALDPSVVPILELAVGTGLWRNCDSEWQPWVRKE
jgi:hypothetical protein